MHGLFITGNHTNVGKTTLAKILISHFSQYRTVKVRKPVESGCLTEKTQLIPQDAQDLLAASNSNETLKQVCPYRFEQVASPEYAAQLSGVNLSLTQLITAVQANINPDDFVIIEGVGGFYSPIAQHTLNADLAMALELPLVVVIKDELGSVNQALLTIKAIEQSGLPIALLVLNQYQEDTTVQALNNAQTIQSYSKIPTHIFNGNVRVFKQLLSKIFPPPKG